MNKKNVSVFANASNNSDINKNRTLKADQRKSWHTTISVQNSDDETDDSDDDRTAYSSENEDGPWGRIHVCSCF